MGSVLRLVATVAVLGPSSILGADYVLTIGGGYSPSGNQVSLEKNVLFFERVLDESPGDFQHTILFADGDDPRRDVQYIDPDATLPRVYELLALVFDHDEHLLERYRNHRVENATNAATVEAVRGWFDEVGSQLVAGDRVILYVTAHGGRAEDKKKPRNTTLHLWGEHDLTVEELANELDKLDPAVAVVIVMVQCFSGGFADVIFDKADPARAPTVHNRCGFFATTHTRYAAGCTPDINEADYREYSSAFWAALIGQTRTGESFERPDYNGNGEISFDEAHAFVLVTSDTIDIPVKTSDAFLREYAKPRGKSDRSLASRATKSESANLTQASESETVTALRPVEPLTADASIDTLLAAADPSERAAIMGLSERLKLERPDRAQEARELAERIEQERRRLRGRLGRAERSAHRTRSVIESAVLAEWPELAGTWNAEARRLVEQEPEAIVALIESHPRYHEWQRRQAEVIELAKRRDELERDWVKCQRLLNLLETVALAHNLPLQADATLLSRFEQLRRAEAASLSRP